MKTNNTNILSTILITGAIVGFDDDDSDPGDERDVRDEDEEEDD
jgi:hypothetical protein